MRVTHITLEAVLALMKIKLEITLDEELNTPLDTVVDLDQLIRSLKAVQNPLSATLAS